MLIKIVFLFLASFTIAHMFVLPAQAITVKLLPSQTLVVQDQELNLSLTLKTITYSHKYLSLNWRSGNNKNSFKMIFTPNTLKVIPLSADDFVVTSSSLGFVNATAQDRLLITLLASRLAGRPSFTYQNNLVKILSKLGALPNGQYQNNKPLCDNRGQWIYGTYTVGYVTQTVLAPIGDTYSSCYGNCGGQCSNWIGLYDNSCLAHDLCHRIEGTQLGECKDELAYATVASAVEPACL